jgi:hypothetical protein
MISNLALTGCARRKSAFVAQTSKSAVPPISKSARGEKDNA